MLQTSLWKSLTPSLSTDSRAAHPPVFPLKLAGTVTSVWWTHSPSPATEPCPLVLVLLGFGVSLARQCQALLGGFTWRERCVEGPSSSHHFTSVSTGLNISLFLPLIWT